MSNPKKKYMVVEVMIDGRIRYAVATQYRKNSLQLHSGMIYDSAIQAKAKCASLNGEYYTIPARVSKGSSMLSKVIHENLSN